MEKNATIEAIVEASDSASSDDSDVPELEILRSGTLGLENLAAEGDEEMLPEATPLRKVSLTGISVSAWQRLAKVNLPYKKCKRNVNRVIHEMERFQGSGMYQKCVYLGKWARTALQDLEKSLEEKKIPGKDATETVQWISDLKDRVELMMAEAQLSLGHLMSVLFLCDKIIKRQNDKMAVARCLQLRAYIMVLIGADKLGEEDIRACVKVLESEFQCKGEELPSMTLAPPPDIEMTFSTADWHRVRRKVILERYPKIRSLYESRSGNPGDGFWEAIMLLFIYSIHVSTGILVSYLKSYIVSLLLSATVGAAAVYGFQALNHDLSHVTRHPGLRYLAMTIASTLCVFPWAMYYQNYHAVHHAFTGTDMDRDGDILFQPWYSPPHVQFTINMSRPKKSRVILKRWSEFFEDEALAADHSEMIREFMDRGDKFYKFNLDLSNSWPKRLFWASFVPMFMYIMFCVRKILLDRAHRPMIQYEGLMLIAQIIAWRIGGLYALIYVWFSGAFSHGGGCHPYFGFWLIQHENTWRSPELDEKITQYSDALSLEQLLKLQPQPTISYTGSCIWQYANFGELQHVEHHDFPMVPARHYPTIRKMAPEFFDHLQSRDSVMKAIKAWLFAPSDETWMQEHGDFARRDVYIDDLWLRRYRYPEDIDEAAQSLLDRITHPIHNSFLLGCCVACALPIRGQKIKPHSVLIAKGAALSCGCSGVPLHVACAKSLYACPLCKAKVTIIPTYAYATHLHHCLSISACRECVALTLTIPSVKQGQFPS